MTLIELFDQTPLDNIIGVLTLRPDKVYFVGSPHPMLEDTDRITRLLAQKGLKVDVEVHTVNTSDTQAMRKTLSEIIEDEPHCLVDTTGGDDRLLMLAADLIREHGLQAQHIHIPSGTVTDTDGDGTVVVTSTPTLTVKELIGLHGGTVTAHTASPACTAEESQILWNLTRIHPREWNSNIKLLMTLEKGHRQGQTVSMSPSAVPAAHKTRYATIRARLTERGIIINESSPKEIRYTYTKPYFRSLLEKAGNLLEHKAFYEATAAMHGETPLFHDVCMGVSIDWEDDPQTTAKPTNNEIDLLVMRGVVPLFVSCKNGDVDENELYKLTVVAERFGGRYAKKMLIVTELEPDSPQAREALIRRAADMDIHLIANAGRLNPAQWHTEFAKAMDLI